MTVRGRGVIHTVQTPDCLNLEYSCTAKTETTGSGIQLASTPPLMTNSQPSGVKPSEGAMCGLRVRAAGAIFYPRQQSA